MHPNKSGNAVKMRKLTGIVRLISTQGQRVGVGIIIRPGAHPPPHPYFKWLKGIPNLSLKGRPKTSREDLFIECMLSILTGVENFRQMYPRNINYSFTLVEGENLMEGYSMGLGFSLATFRAAAAATGFWPKEYDDKLQFYGWNLLNDEGVNRRALMHAKPRRGKKLPKASKKVRIRRSKVV